MKELSEKTLIPLSLIITFIIASSYVVSINGRVEASSERLNRISDKVVRSDANFQEIRDRLARIEGALEYLKNRR